MKILKYMVFAFLCAPLLASCMGDNFDEPAMDGAIPYGNNALTETNVISIDEFKQRFAAEISGSAMRKVNEDLKIKGVVTGNDAGGNLYNEISLQDATGALLVAIGQGGLCNYLPVGTELLIDLNGLMVGAYGNQPEVGGIYTNTKTGAQSIGRMDRNTWATHFKILGQQPAESMEPEVFDMSKVADEDYLAANCGKLMTVKGVSFKDADGHTVFAPDDGSVRLTANCANRALNELDSTKFVVRTSAYANFANDFLPQGPLNITGIFTRFRGVWQLLIRTPNDIQAGSAALFKETFANDQGAFTIENITPLPDGITYVWNWDAKYGMKASAYISPNRYETHSRLVSPMIELPAGKSLALQFDQAGKFFSSDVKEDIQVEISTDNKVSWQVLPLDSYLDGSSWDFITTKADLTSYAGKQVYIAFHYNSSTTTAPTWEIKNVIIE